MSDGLLLVQLPHASPFLWNRCGSLEKLQIHQKAVNCVLIDIDMHSCISNSLFFLIIFELNFSLLYDCYMMIIDLFKLTLYFSSFFYLILVKSLNLLP